jgi:hypothetical protein
MAKYIWPLPASIAVNQEFGADPGGFNPPGGHTGMDFLAPYGTPVRAIADGVVKHADWFRGTYAGNPWWFEPSFGGIVVVIDHGAAISAYAHLSRTDLNPGDKVRQGEIIAYSGNTRDGVNTFGPHLHFEILPDGWDFNNGTYGRVNPRKYCTSYWTGTSGQSTTITPIKPAPAKKVSEMPAYKRVPATPPKKPIQLGAGIPWTLKDEAGRINQNIAVNGLGHYDVDLFLRGIGLPEGEHIDVTFYVIPTGGKKSAYFINRVFGTKDGTFAGCARFSMPILKAARVEVDVKATFPAVLADYRAEVKTWAQ